MEKERVYVRRTICVGGRYYHKGVIVSLPTDAVEKEMKAGRVRYPQPGDEEDPVITSLYRSYATE